MASILALLQLVVSLLLSIQSGGSSIPFAQQQQVIQAAGQAVQIVSQSLAQQNQTTIPTSPTITPSAPGTSSASTTTSNPVVTPMATSTVTPSSTFVCPKNADCALPPARRLTSASTTGFITEQQAIAIVEKDSGPIPATDQISASFKNNDWYIDYAPQQPTSSQYQVQSSGGNASYVIDGVTGAIISKMLGQ